MSEVEPQTVWGWLISADFFFGGTGASLFLVSLVLSLYGIDESLAQTGLLTGIAFVIVGLAFLVAHQWNRRGKFLLMLNRPRTSWLSRGTIFNVIFLVFGILYTAPHWFGWLPWTQSTDAGVTIGLIGGVAAFLVVLYPGMFLSSLNSIPFWNTPIVPLLFISYGLTGAIGMLSILSSMFVATTASNSVKSLIWWQMVLLVCTIVLVAAQLAWAYHAKGESRKSVLELIRGPLFLPFVVGSLVIGLFFPVVVSAFSYQTGSPDAAAIVGVLVLIGSVFHKRSLLAAGNYVELMPEPWPLSQNL
jgi:formate-dependent nitrite reductase membrane component NrfD